jgi:magnesium transporter
VITLLYRPIGSRRFDRRSPEDLHELRADGGLVWLDVAGEPRESVERVAGLFGFDALAVEDILDEVHYPKVDKFPDYLFVVLHGLAEEDGRITTMEIDVAVGHGYLVSFHSEHSMAIDWLMERSIDSDLLADAGPDVLLAQLAEVQGRRFLPLVSELDDLIDDLEDRALDGDPEVVAEIQVLRSDAARLRRVVGPLRDTLLELSRPLSDVISERAQVRFESAYDHHYRLVENLDAARAMLAAVLETYRSTVAERMNEVMKVLTVYTAVLLPLTLLAGIYGMNFVNMPELEWSNGYYLLLAVMGVVAIAQWVYFARRGFVGRFRPTKVARGVGVGLVKVARLPFTAATHIIREVGPAATRTRPGDGH